MLHKSCAFMQEAFNQADILSALTICPNSADYWHMLKQWLKKLGSKAMTNSKNLHSSTAEHLSIHPLARGRVIQAMLAHDGLKYAILTGSISKAQSVMTMQHYKGLQEGTIRGNNLPMDVSQYAGHGKPHRYLAGVGTKSSSGCLPVAQRSGYLAGNSMRILRVK